MVQRGRPRPSPTGRSAPAGADGCYGRCEVGLLPNAHRRPQGRHDRPAARTLTPAPDRPTAPFLGSRIVTDIRMADVFEFLNERTLFSTQWQFRKGNASAVEYERQMREVAYPALDRLKRQCLAEDILRPAVVYGYFGCAADGDDLVIYQDDGRTERMRFTFPRQDGGEFLVPKRSYFVPGDGDDDRRCGRSFMAVTMGAEVSRRAKPNCSTPASTRITCTCTAWASRSAGGALAEFWHQGKSAPSGASPATTRPSCASCSRSITAAAGTRSAIPLVRTLKIRPSSSSYCGPSGSGWH